MSILQSIPSNFNTQLTYAFDGNQLCVDGGLVLMREFADKINFQGLLDEQIKIEDKRKFKRYTYPQILFQLILQSIAGYHTDSAANQLAKNQAYASIQGFQSASQASISRFLSACTAENIAQFNALNFALVDLHYKSQPVHTLFIDVDSTHSDTYGHQEEANYNTHYQVNGYHPQLVYDQDGFCLGAILHPGNDYTSKDCDLLLRPILEHLKTLGIPEIILRGDSGFATPVIYDLCEELEIFYVIRLKLNSKLKGLAKFVNDIEDYQGEATQYFSKTDYQAGSWKCARHVAIMAERSCEELFFNHTFIVHNFPEVIAPSSIISFYKARGAMENHIKEAKHGFNFDKTDSHSFLGNHVRMWIAVLAQNLIQLFKTEILSGVLKKATVATLRTHLFKFALRMTTHARQIIFHFDRAHVYRREFYEALRRLNRFELNL